MITSSETVDIAFVHANKNINFNLIKLDYGAL
jgi:hypothetical protein